MDILLLGDGEMYNVIIVQKPPQLSSLGHCRLLRPPGSASSAESS